MDEKESTETSQKSKHRRTESTVKTVNDVEGKQNGIQAEENEIAIKLEKAYKSYGSRKHKHPVLVGLDMEVGKGHIYGLLGKIKPFRCFKPFRFFKSCRFVSIMLLLSILSDLTIFSDLSICQLRRFCLFALSLSMLSIFLFVGLILTRSVKS